MSFLAALGSFLGSILKYILPELIDEWQKPRDVKVAGYSKELKKSQDKSIESQMLPYGRCPQCNAPGVSRERRPNGNDVCRNGHSYPAKEAVYGS